MIRSMLRNTSVTPPSVIPLENIIEYWNMNGNGNGYNGNNQLGDDLTYPSSTLIGQACQYGAVPSARGQVLNDSSQFSGGNGAVDNVFSFCFWVKWDSVDTDILFGLRGAGAQEYDITQISNTMRLRMYSLNSGSNFKQVSKSQTFAINTWYHICMTYSGTGFPLVYINASSTSNNTSTTGTYVAMRSLNSPLTLGGVTFSTVFDLQGQLDEVAMFNIELTPTQVTALYNAGIAGTPIIG